MTMRSFLKYKRHVLYRTKLKVFVLSMALAGVLFLLYQMFLLEQQLEDIRGGSKAGDYSQYTFSESYTYKVHSDKELLARGIHYNDNYKYIPNSRGKFVCGVSNNEIDFAKVNDDYCDCPEDGSDEPGTNACQNGRFVCLVQGSNIGFSDIVPSSRVNDGICDCCDGSDEWKTLQIPLRLKESIQQKLGRYQSPCPNLCLT